MGTHPIFESDFDCLTEPMDRIIPALNDDPACEGYIIVQLDGTIIHSAGKLEHKANVTQAMLRIFHSLRRTSSTPRVVFQNDSGYIMAYENSGKIVVVQKCPKSATGSQASQLGQLDGAPYN